MADRYISSLLFLLSLIIGLSFQGTHGLFESTEGRYAEVGREMIESGNYLEPTLGGRPHWTKPPMAYWAIAAGLDLFGRNAWGARFFNAIAFCLTALAVMAMGTTLWNRRTGYISGLIYMSSVLPAVAAAVLTTDTLLTFWEVLAVLAYVKAFHASSLRATRWWNRAMWLLFGVAFFTKGPPALLPWIAMLFFHLRSPARFRLLDPLGIVVFLAAGFWWYGLVVARHPALLDYFVGEEIIGRNITNHFGRHSEWYAPLTIYLPVLTIGLGGWLYLALPAAFRELRERSARGAPLFGAPGSPLRLMLLWIIVPLVILSLSKSRLHLYVLPLHAPIALAAAFLITRRWNARRLTVVAVVSVVICMTIRGSLSLWYPNRNAKRVHASIMRIEDSGARYALVNEGGLYGMQFYFDGRLERVSLGKKQTWADQDLNSFVRELETSPSDSPCVFITNSAGAKTIEQQLDAAHIAFSRDKAYRHDVIVAGTREIVPPR